MVNKLNILVNISEDDEKNHIHCFILPNCWGFHPVVGCQIYFWIWKFVQKPLKCGVWDRAKVSILQWFAGFDFSQKHHDCCNGGGWQFNREASLYLSVYSVSLQICSHQKNVVYIRIIYYVCKCDIWYLQTHAIHVHTLCVFVYRYTCYDSLFALLTFIIHIYIGNQIPRSMFMLQ